MRTIMVVEDEPTIREVLAESLREAGYSVLVAKAAEEAISILASGIKVDLVFSDVKLAGPMSGLGLARWMRDWNRALPIVLASGENDVVLPLDRQHVFPFLAKPFGAADVIEVVGQVLGASPDG
jgi:CheY-like chemotaxis protein